MKSKRKHHLATTLVAGLITLESLTSFNPNKTVLHHSVKPKIIPPTTFSYNPFKTPQGEMARAKKVQPTLAKEYLERAINSAKTKYLFEQRTIAENNVFINIIRDSLSTDTTRKNYIEKQKLPAFKTVGSQTLNPKSRHYKPFLEEFDLKKEDCTLFVLEALAKTSQDTMFQYFYDNYAQGNFSPTEFPPLFAHYLHNHGYATIFVSSNTTKANKKTWYKDGSRRGAYTKLLMPKIRNKTYYAPIDYMITDEDLETKAAEAFIKSTPKIVTVHDNYHMGFDDYGTFFEARREHIPTRENVYTASDFYKGLLQEGTRNWKNAILFVPEYLVPAFLTERIE